MTAPLFRTRELLSFLREFDGSLLGWGTDWWYMNHLLARRDWQRKIAVVDAAPCENPLDIEKPNGRELNRVGTVETRRDQWLRAKAARRLREFEPREYGAIRQGTVAAAVARLGFVARWWRRRSVPGKKLRITLVKSIIGLSPKQEATVKALGLRRMHQSVSHDDTPTVRGMIAAVPHMLEVSHETR